jgi:hypothetical protein
MLNRHYVLGTQKQNKLMQRYKVTSQKRYRLHGKGSEHANGGCFG